MKGKVAARYTSLLLALFLVAGVAGGLQWSPHSMTASANGGATTIIAIEPASQQAALGSQVTVNITVDSTAEPLASLQVDLTFDTTVLNVTGVSDGGMFDNWGPGTPTINNTVGVVQGIAAYNDLGSGNTTAQGTLATVTFNVTDEGSGAIDVTDVLAYGYDGSYYQIDAANIAVTGGTIATATMLNLEPAESMLSSGDTVSLDVWMTPAEPVQSLSFNVTFYPSILQADTVINGSLFDFPPVDYTINNTAGTISNISLLRLGPAVGDPAIVATIQFTAADAGVSPVEIQDALVRDSGGDPLVTASSGATVTVDGTPPEITDHTPGNATTGDDFTFNATVTDNLAVDTVTVTYWYGSGTPTTATMETGSDYMKTITIAEDAIHDLHYYINATDTSGNWNQTDTMTVTVEDNDSPAVTATSEDVTVGTGDTVTLWANGTDNIAVTGANITIDGDSHPMTLNEPEDRWEYSYMAPSDQTGDLTYTVTVYDAAGNTGTSAVYTITIEDDDNPTITATSEDVTVGTGNTVTLWVSGTDNIEVTAATITIDGGAAQDMTWNTGQSRYEYSYAASSSSTANHDYAVTLADEAGNTAASSTYTITVNDNDNPSLSLSGPSGTIDTSSVSYSWSASDNVGVATVQYRLDGYDTSWITTSGDSKTYTGLADGSYTFQVRATDAAGNTATSTRSITVDTNTPPSASFTYTPSSPTDLDTITFDASASTDTDGDIVNWTWAFGDGTKAYGETATQTYADNDTYTVTLTVTDDKDDTDTLSKQVTVANDPPEAVITTDPSDTAQIDEEIQFNSTLSGDDDGTIASYAWDFGDGNTSTQANPTHAYEKDGDYQVTLTVTDNDGDTDSATVTLTVEEDQPDYLLPIIAIIVLVVIAIVVVLVWRRRSMGGE